MKEIFGEVLSEGVAFANITFIKQINNYQEVLLNNDEIEQEIEKADSVFKKAIANINAELEGPYAKQNEEILAILKGHYILIEDGEISDQIKSFINDEKIDFTSACYKTIDFYKSIFSKMTDDYLKARIDDIRDIIERFINIFNEKTDDDYKGIIVAYDITPSVVAKFNQANVKGIITENGTKNCHSAIMARTVGIPYITNIKNINQLFCGNENVIINTFNESIIINPNSQQINEYEKIEQEYIQDTSHLNDFIGKPALLNDGEFIDLKVNISNENDVLIANNYGATSVGLLRSEYIYMNLEDFPTEEYLYTQYKKMTKDFEGEITIRTLDVGGDKSIDYFKIEKEQNPYLGYRAIRYCLEHQDMFKTQIKAILRVSAERNIQIMIPMITSLDEVKTVKMLIDVSKQELQLEGKAFDGNIKVGIMIETPASVLIADDLAKEL
ncbi:MAG: phosphoenolpyruvate--protein phosphotransferase, partial [Candidatus Izemoplasmatales bacterium]